MLKWLYLEPDGQGGLCAEAARALIDSAFTELNLHKDKLSCWLQQFKVNESQKLGFTLEARIETAKMLKAIAVMI